MKNNNYIRIGNKIFKKNTSFSRSSIKERIPQNLKFEKNQKIIKIASNKNKQTKSNNKKKHKNYHKNEYPKNISKNLNLLKNKSKNIKSCKFINSPNCTSNKNLFSNIKNNIRYNYNNYIITRNNSQTNKKKPKNMLKGTALIIEDPYLNILIKNHAKRKRSFDGTDKISFINNKMKSKKSVKNFLGFSPCNFYNDAYSKYNKIQLRSEINSNLPKDLIETSLSTNIKEKSSYNISIINVNKSFKNLNILKFAKTEENKPPNQNNDLNKNYLNFSNIRKLCKKFLKNNNFYYHSKDKKRSNSKHTNIKYKNSKIKFSKETKKFTSEIINKKTFHKSLLKKHLTSNIKNMKFINKSEFLNNVFSQINSPREKKNPKILKNNSADNNKYKIILNNLPKINIIYKSKENSRYKKFINKCDKNKLEKDSIFSSDNKYKTENLFYNRRSSRNSNSSSSLLSSNLSDSILFISNPNRSQQNQILNKNKLKKNKFELNIIKQKQDLKISSNNDKNIYNNTIKNNNIENIIHPENYPIQNDEINKKNNEKTKFQKSDKNLQKMNHKENNQPVSPRKINLYNKIISIKKISNVNESNYQKPINHYFNDNSHLDKNPDQKKIDEDSDIKRIQDHRLLKENPYSRSSFVLKDTDRESLEVVFRNVDSYEFSDEIWKNKVKNMDLLNKNKKIQSYKNIVSSGCTSDLCTIHNEDDFQYNLK